MKIQFSITVILTAAILLAGCKNENIPSGITAPESNTSSVSVSQMKPATDTETEITDKEISPVENPYEKPNIIPITLIQDNVFDGYDEDEDYDGIEYQMVALAGDPEDESDDNEEVSAFEEFINRYQAELTDKVSSVLSSVKGNKATVKCLVYRTDSYAVSFSQILTVSNQTSTLCTYTVDPHSGKIIQLSDIVTDFDSFKKVLSQYAEDTVVESLMNNLDGASWNLSYFNLVLNLNGTKSVEIPIDECYSFINLKYLAIPDQYAADINTLPENMKVNYQNQLDIFEEKTCASVAFFIKTTEYEYVWNCMDATGNDDSIFDTNLNWSSDLFVCNNEKLEYVSSQQGKPYECIITSPDRIPIAFGFDSEYEPVTAVFSIQSNGIPSADIGTVKQVVAYDYDYSFSDDEQSSEISFTTLAGLWTAKNISDSNGDLINCYLEIQENGKISFWTSEGTSDDDEPEQNISSVFNGKATIDEGQFSIQLKSDDGNEMAGTFFISWATEDASENKIVVLHTSGNSLLAGMEYSPISFTAYN